MVPCPSTCPPVYVARILWNTSLAERRENRIYDAGCLKVYTNKQLQDTMGVLFIIWNAAIVRKTRTDEITSPGSTSKITKVERVTHLRKERIEQRAVSRHSVSLGSFALVCKVPRTR